MRRLFPTSHGMIVVDQGGLGQPAVAYQSVPLTGLRMAVLPEGPADKLLEPGDVVLEVAGQPCPGFLELEACLDGSVGAHISVKIQRGGQVKC
jgi:S1-C subfamily serine protease